MIYPSLDETPSEGIVWKKTKNRNIYDQVPHLTREAIWESHKNTRKHHTQESQEINSFPAGDHKAARTRQDSITKTNTKHKQQKGSTKKQRLVTVSKKILEGLNTFNGTDLVLILMLIKIEKCLIHMKDP